MGILPCTSSDIDDRAMDAHTFLLKGGDAEKPDVTLVLHSSRNGCAMLH